MNAHAAVSRLGALARFGRANGRYIWIVGLLLYLAIVFYVGWQDVRDTLAGLRYPYVLALVLVEVAALGLRAWKWRIALGPGQDSLRACFISKAGGNLTPARVGEFSPLLLAEHRSPRVGAWIILDRVLEASSTILLGLVGLVAVLGLGAWGGLTWWALLILVLLGGTTYLFSNQVFMDKVAQRFSTRSLANRALNFLKPVSLEMARLGSRAPLLAGLSLSATVLDLLIGYLLFMSFGLGVAFTVLALGQLVHALASVFPLSPNATGIPYVAAAAVFHELGGVPVEVLAMAVGLRFILGNITFWSFFLIAVPGDGTRRKFLNQGDLFDELASGTVLYEYTPEALEKLNEVVDASGLMLDIGCGDGLIAEALTADRKIGIDISPRCAKLSNDRGLKASVADASVGLPFAPESFDTVVCIDVLHHLGQLWDGIFEELDDILRPGGRLCIVEPDVRNPFVKWTQAPHSPIRVAPWHDEPAIDPADLIARLERLGYEFSCEPIHIEGRQTQRSIFPLWQRLLKAPFVIAMAHIYRNRPNKFALIARKPLG